MKSVTRITLTAMLAGLLFSPMTMAEKGQGHHCKAHGGQHGPAWKSSLSQAQRDKLKKMKVDFLKVKFPLKARIKTAKIDLAVLATADAPDNKAIGAKIDELLALKKEILQAKYALKISVRKELKPEQRAEFDKYQLKKAKRKKCRKHSKH